jgi:hypothetical protein
MSSLSVVPRYRTARSMQLCVHTVHTDTQYTYRVHACVCVHTHSSIPCTSTHAQKPYSSKTEIGRKLNLTRILVTSAVFEV